MKPSYNHEISLGSILALVTFLVTLGVFELPRASDVKVIERDVNRHEEMLKQLTSSHQLIAANLQVLTAIVNDHLAWDKHPGQGMQKPILQQTMKYQTKVLPLTVILTLAATAAWAQTTASPLPAADASLFQPIVDALTGKFGWFVTVISILGTLRLVVKPVMLVIEAIVKNSASSEDDAKLAAFESGPIYRWLLWSLDWVASIKAPSAGSTNPLVK